MKIVFFLLFSMIVLNACSTVQERNIVQTDVNSYEITKSNPSYLGPNVLEKQISREARNFCASLKKRLHIIAIHETKPPFVGSKVPFAEMKFECIYPIYLEM